MKTGTYIYDDGSSSEVFDDSKELRGVVCNVTDTHAVLVAPFEGEEKVEWQKAQEYCQSKGWKCPTIDELNGMYLNKAKINEALKAAGKETLRDVSYWSSTEVWFGYAWIVSFINGYRGQRAKYKPYYVRSTLPFVTGGTSPE